LLRLIASTASITYNYLVMSEILKNILIIKPSSLGDIVLALPALSALHRNFPNARISWLVRPEFAAILENHPHLTEIIHFDRKYLGRAWFNPRAFAALVSIIRRIRHARFDAVFDFQGLFRTASLARLSGSARRFGMANARELATLFYTQSIPQDQSCIHLVDYYLKMAQSAGASYLRVEFIVPQNPAAADSVRKLLQAHNVEPDNYVVFVPGSTDQGKRWPIERFAALADRISSDFQLPIVATASSSEAEVVRKLTTLTSTAIADLAGQTSLGELIALLRSARLVVSNDTGPGHIAAALGTPLVLMFSWSNPARIAPYGRLECMVARDPFSRGPKIRSNDPKQNIRTITVEEVYQKVREQLNS